MPVLSARGGDALARPEHGHDVLQRRRNGTGGDPLLCQHLFWFFGHPEVYIMILPAMGLVSEIMPVFARKPIFGYRAMVFSMVAIGVPGLHRVGPPHVRLGHEPRVVGDVLAVDDGHRGAFGHQDVQLDGHGLEGLDPVHDADVLRLAFVSMFVIGGLSGIFMASTPVDLFIHHTYFIVAHFHYVLFGGSLFALAGGDLLLVPEDVRAHDG